VLDSRGSVAGSGAGDTAFKDPRSGTTGELRALAHCPRHLTGRLPLSL